MDARGRPTVSDRLAAPGLRLFAAATAVGVGSAAMLFLLRVAASRSPLSRAWAADEISSQIATYVYLATSTACVIALGGLFVSRTVARLLATSRTDPLTQVANRRGLEERLSAEIARAAEAGTAVALMIVDVDELKAINDRSGHAAGDAALRAVSDVLVRACRSRDLVARWGGDEFAVVLSRTRAVEAAVVADRVHRALADTRAGESDVSVSIGIADHEGPDPVPPAALFEAADRALFAAKRGGRHRTSYASTDDLRPSFPPEGSGTVRARRASSEPATPAARVLRIAPRGKP